MLHLARSIQLVLCLTALLGRPAAAKTWRLDWRRGSGADTCVDADTLRKRVQRRLGRDPFARAGTYTLRGEVRREARAWRVDFRILDVDGTVKGWRQLEAHKTDCRRLDQVIVLIATIAVDTGALGGGSPESKPEPEPAPPREPAPRPAPAPEPPSAAAPAPAEPPSAAAPAPKPSVVRRVVRRPSRTWRPSLAVAGVLDVGTMPDPAPGVALELAVGPLILGVAYWPGAEVSAAGGSARFQLAAVAAGVRPTFELARRLRLALSAALELGWLHGQGDGFDADLSSTQTLVALRGDAALQLRMSRRLFTGLGVGICGQLRRDTFYVDDHALGPRSIHEPWPVSLRAGLFLGLSLL